MDHGERARKIISAADIAAVDVRNGKKASIDHTTQPPEETTGNWGSTQNQTIRQSSSISMITLTTKKISQQSRSAA